MQPFVSQPTIVSLSGSSPRHSLLGFGLWRGVLSRLWSTGLRPGVFSLVAVAVTLTFTHAANAAAANNEKPSRPNIVVIITDDLGYADIGANGGKEIPTPNIDSIAKNGVRFSCGYVSGTYCSPTRAGLLSGRYQQRFGHEFNPGGNGEGNTQFGLSLKERTLPEKLKEAGYKTALVGKWHLGHTPQFHPLSRGFEEYFGFTGGAHSYTNLPTGTQNSVQRGTNHVAEKEFLTAAFTREAVAFLDRNNTNAFFLQLAYNAVHGPLDTDPKYFDRFSHITDERRRRFAGLLAGLDDGVGAVLKKLREAGLEENTLVFFFSDNGGPTAGNTSRNDPLRGFKAQTWEGGIRVPFLAQWKGKLPSGRVYDQPIIQLDVHATALAVAGVSEKNVKLDGVNLLPFLVGENKSVPHDALYWRFGGQLAIRQGDWKLVKAPSGERRLSLLDDKATTEGAALYNLASDISETNNLAAKEPKKFQELAASWAKWNKELAEPAWRPGGGRRNADANTVTSNASKGGPWKSGDALARVDAPEIANHPLAITAHIEPESTNGVIVAQGANANGYALFLHEGRLGFAVRASRALTLVTAREPLGRGHFEVEAKLFADGRVQLAVDGRTVAEGRAPSLITTQPGDGLTVGSDGNGAVGDYEAPNAFQGAINNVRVRTL